MRTLICVLNWKIRQKCSSFRYLYIMKTMVLLRKKQYHKMMNGHISKITRMLRRDVDVDVDEHILNISTHQVTFFQKLVLCRGLKDPLALSIMQGDRN